MPNLAAVENWHRHLLLDHMCDQLTSHGQLGVTAVRRDGAWFVPVATTRRAWAGRTTATFSSRAAPRSASRCAACRRGRRRAAARACTFCCPLDEAFAEAVIDLRPPAERRGACAVRLEPYGRFAGDAAAGRKWIGRFRTALTPATGRRSRRSAPTSRPARARRQRAPHPRVCFKSFARAFRRALGSGGGAAHGGAPPAGPLLPAAPPPAPPRRAAARDKGDDDRGAGRPRRRARGRRARGAAAAGTAR